MEWNFQAFQFLNVLFSLMALSQYYITSKSPGLTNKQTNKTVKNSGFFYKDLLFIQICIFTKIYLLKIPVINEITGSNTRHSICNQIMI